MNADWISSALTPEQSRQFQESLTPEELRALRRDWRFWARDEQCPPQTRDWTTWLFLGGRGAGKTRAGAEWIKNEIEAGEAGHIALIGETLHDVRAVMVEGSSGLLSLAWRERPRFQPTLRRILFGNGAIAQIFSAEDPDGLRGFQFDRAWADGFPYMPGNDAVIAYPSRADGTLDGGSRYGN